jgi:hypothetical protein
VEYGARRATTDPHFSEPDDPMHRKRNPSWCRSGIVKKIVVEIIVDLIDESLDSIITGNWYPASIESHAFSPCISGRAAA